MRKVETREINGTSYTVKQFGALQGRKVLLRITKLGSSVVGAIAASSGDGLARALDAWSVSAKEEDFEAICDALAECSSVAVTLESTTAATIQKELKNKGFFDDHFAGKYGEMLLWLAFALEVNFSGFLDEIKSGGAVTLASLGIKTQSP